jgi:soluble lytic murein transglycosylase-like protein
MTMAVKNIIDLAQPLRPRSGLEGLNPISRPGLFKTTLRRVAELPGTMPADTTQAKTSALDELKGLARMELMNLNQALLSAFSSDSSPSGSGGSDIGLPSMSGMLQIVQTMQNMLAGNRRTEKPSQPTASETSQTTDTTAKASPKIDLAGADLERIIAEAARDNELDPHLVRAVIKTESNFNAKAVSKAGAMGLMQLMPGTAQDLGVEDPFDPVENVYGGARYLKQMLDRYAGNIKKALAAYNWGPGNLEKSTGHLPDETRNYVRIVSDRYQKYSDAIKA